MLWEFTLRTGRQGFYDITPQVRQALEASGADSGACLVYCPHTTAGITINENADPDVVADLLFALDRAFPEHREYRHVEGNSAAHLKSSCMGCSAMVPVEQGKLALGTWQGIYFCEFDGPRRRKFTVKVMG